ncbi:MAG: hypothetical protein L0027_08585 [Candidatus Rokubacteria bacterium]|nr:hypothetical protein [Candidatus Rokubacteria bacterium]
MSAAARLIEAAARLEGDGRGCFDAARDLESWPGIVHGGALVGILDGAARALAAPAGPRIVEARLTTSVPLESALALEGHAHEGGVTVSILEAGQPLTSVSVAPLLAASGARTATAPAPGGGALLPASEQCLACGAANPVGLQARLCVHEDGVWVAHRPRDAWRDGDGAVHPALAPVLLDEVAWWLGAITMGEGGVTNRIHLELLEPHLPGDGTLLAGGRFDEVAPVDRRKTFWRTAITLTHDSGAVLARASIVYRGGPEYSARQLPFFRARTPAELFRRLFPAHASGTAR